MGGWHWGTGGGDECAGGANSHRCFCRTLGCDPMTCSRVLACQFCWKMATESSACDWSAAVQGPLASAPASAAGTSTAAAAGLMSLRVFYR